MANYFPWGIDNSLSVPRGSSVPYHPDRNMYSTNNSNNNSYSICFITPNRDSACSGDEVISGKSDRILELINKIA